MALVPANTTTIMVNIYSSPSGAGRVHYGRATLVARARRKDNPGVAHRCFNDWRPIIAPVL